MDSAASSGGQFLNGVLEYSVSLAILLLVVAGLAIALFFVIRHNLKMAEEASVREQEHQKNLQLIYDKQREENERIQREIVSKVTDLTNITMQTINRAQSFFDMFMMSIGVNRQNNNTALATPKDSPAP